MNTLQFLKFAGGSLLPEEMPPCYLASDSEIEDTPDDSSDKKLSWAIEPKVRQAIEREERLRMRREQLLKQKDDRSAGPQWFNMRLSDFSDEQKQELELLKYQAMLNPLTKHYRTRRGAHELPAIFQVGKLINPLTDRFDVPKKLAKKNALDLLIESEEFQERHQAVLERVRERRPIPTRRKKKQRTKARIGRH